MNFELTADRRMLADTLRRYLNDRYGFSERCLIAESDHGWSRKHWARFSELGVVGALFGEAVGGFGGEGFDIAVVFEQLGRALVVEPFLGTLMAGVALNNALPETVISGEEILAFAHGEPASRHNFESIATRAEQDGESWVLNGEKAVVPQIETATRVIVTAIAPSGPSLFSVERAAAGMQVRGYPMIDGGRGGEISFRSTPAILIRPASTAIIEHAVAAGILALCWEAIGIMDFMSAATLDFMRTRQQFGVAIGKFQALQHRMGTVALEIEQARSAAINAAAALSGERWLRERAVSAAKFTIGRVGTLVVEESIQIHGGIAMTWDLSLSHYAKRLTIIGHQLGDEDYHLDRFIALASAA